jgi:D-psicose/D-tagatose/L-ribulose 3-epimerase
MSVLGTCAIIPALMARLGINLMAWSAGVDTSLFPALRAMGYDGVELPIFDPSRFDAAGVRAALRENGLACTASSALPAGASLLDRDQIGTGVRFLRGVLEACAAVGAGLLCGPLYAPVGQLPGRPRTEPEINLRSRPVAGASGKSRGNRSPHLV